MLVGVDEMEGVTEGAPPNVGVTLMEKTGVVDRLALRRVVVGVRLAVLEGEAPLVRDGVCERDFDGVAVPVVDCVPVGEGVREDVRVFVCV